ncbi:transaldolase [Streptomyces sp. WAC05374]|uniref:transaldolase n=1 Tax=Streptomyces sp. WAC05374 TaxID=2487420 RepID=UPI000F87D7AE|nr:transaldolase [Streptomyces sp. WAC05374]RST19659.1 transaldolase [Streptomyces sp. WAC05374]TDF50003.1 transaldolase [Streptomyces sp. WAC05374]TDF57730.1 transaldolase [Streptomyces sp. WAC05374]TDF60258.1 transaldolase [Streptomyces sp. WAC05374]
MNDALRQLTELGVSIWLDDLSREQLTTGALASVLRDRHVVGVTTNPSIFHQAIAGGTGSAYDGDLRDLALRGVSAEEAVRALTTADVRAAADVLRPVYQRTDGHDGRVSLEVDPRLAHDTDATLAEARHLWWTVDRPNLLIKIPATPAGLPAISRAIAEGISVNVTLIFSIDRYRAVVDAYQTGLEEALGNGRDLSVIESVASFFVSRLDTETDRRLEEIGTPEALELRGRTGIANSRLAHKAYEETVRSPRWQALQAQGANAQRLLWTSTSTKNPAYPDTLYVSELVTAGTVNTLPPQTLEAVADHGDVHGDTVRAHHEDAARVLATLGELGIDYDEVVQLLEDQGVAAFAKAWNSLLESVEASLVRLRGSHEAR